MTKRKSKRRFILMSLVLLVGILLSVLRFNIPFTDYTYNGFLNSIPLGFDLQGGVSVVLEASLPDDDLSGDLSKNIEGTISRIKVLLEDQGYNEYNVYKQNTNRIVVEVAKLTDTDFLFEQLSQPASFKITTEESAEAEARITGKDIDTAGNSARQNENGQIEEGVYIVFNEQGKKKFADLTAEISQSSGTMYFYVGDDSSPFTRLTTSSAITNGYVFFSSQGMTLETAKQLSLKIISGSFASKVTMVENYVVSASLGMDALNFGMISVFVALLLSLILLIIFYKDFGLLSSFATLFWAVLLIFFMQAVPFARLNISSFAGIIVALLVNVIAYVIMHNSIKNENNKGKKLHMSVKAGYKSSIGLIVDYHAVALISSIVLLIVGIQAVKGFAITLLLGSAISLFVSLVLFKWFLNLYLPLNTKNVNKFNLEKAEVKLDEV